ncbi:MAG: hypothetical protein IKH65_10990, partial [Clostridia bacterium]|nr:hypothetical protein [Clostridia bacterium]
PENYTPYQEPENQINNKKHLVQNIIPNTENIENTKSDVESNFSFFSGFSTFKNKKQICFHILTGFIVICQNITISLNLAGSAIITYLLERG